jgi:hypothetical protein
MNNNLRELLGDDAAELIERWKKEGRTGSIELNWDKGSVMVVRETSVTRVAGKRPIEKVG